MSSVNPLVNVGGWIADNEKDFLPPVCNKLMWGHGQLKVMFVGGPNIRNDYHIEEGEELFYQVKGDMVLKIMEKGQPKDIPIKEGEIFVLPGRIPHSPQRFENTVGLVIERERLDSETDGLRYYRPTAPTEPLWEKWFHCHDLGSQLGPVIKEYFASEQHKTGVPSPDTVSPKPPVNIDTNTQVESPRPLAAWLDELLSSHTGRDPVAMYSKGEFQVHCCKPGTKASLNVEKDRQLWIWQQRGTSTLSLSGGDKVTLDKDDSFLLEPCQAAEWEQGHDGVGLMLAMAPGHHQ